MGHSPDRQSVGFQLRIESNFSLFQRHLSLLAANTPKGTVVLSLKYYKAGFLQVA
jgi:hypothetical protein